MMNRGRGFPAIKLKQTPENNTTELNRPKQTLFYKNAGVSQSNCRTEAGERRRANAPTGGRRRRRVECRATPGYFNRGGYGTARRLSGRPRRNARRPLAGRDRSRRNGPVVRNADVSADGRRKIDR